MKLNKDKQAYKFPEDKEKQLQYIYDMMEEAEDDTNNELSMCINRMHTGDYHIEVYEHPEEIDDELELVDWYTGKTMKDVFDYLLERYL